MTTASTTVTIQNRLGMHARPAMLFAEIAGKFASEITVGHAEADPVQRRRAVPEAGQPGVAGANHQD